MFVRMWKLTQVLFLFNFEWFTGTVITEWDDGKARCEKFLQDVVSYKKFADQLVQIALYYKFDGWLINIENKIEVIATHLLLRFN